MRKPFEIEARWLPSDADQKLAEHLAELRVFISDKNVTRTTSSYRVDQDHIDVPPYYLAEWMTENWWSILWEPRKSDEPGDDPDYVQRHCTIAAQHGFALPRIQFSAVSDQEVEVACTSRFVAEADVKFVESGKVYVPKSELAGSMRAFVSAVVDHLTEKGIKDTDLQEAWELILDTDGDAEEYCILLGALGLSPYSENTRIDDVIDRSVEMLGMDLTKELCFASTEATLKTAFQRAKGAVDSLDLASVVDLTPLSPIKLVNDSYDVPAWQRGIKAAKLLRQRLGIREDDALGSDVVFGRLNVETTSQRTAAKDETTPILGAVRTEREEARFGLLQSSAPQRRFAAARATFLAWSSIGTKKQHLITQSVTRDQQASRAFAAEIVAPIAHIRRRAERRHLTRSAIASLSEEFNVTSDVVWKQAINNGLSISRYS